VKAKLTALKIKVIDLHTNHDMPPPDIQPDRIHLTPEGRRLLAAWLLPLVMTRLGRRNRGPLQSRLPERGGGGPRQL